MASFQVIKRAALPSTVVGAGGELRDFRWSDALCEFLPAASRLSIRWLKLREKDLLEPRVYPAETVLILCAGSGQVLGDLNAGVAEGDMVVIPAGSECGLSAGAEGLNAITLQFGQRASDPPLRFVDAAGEPGDKSALAGLFEYSAARLRTFEGNSLFALLDGDALREPTQRKAIVEAFEIWVTGAGVLLFGDQAPVRDESGAPGSARKQLVERRSSPPPARGSWRPSRRDSVIEAMANWFAYQTNVLDSVERAAIMRLVVAPARTVCEAYGATVLDRKPASRALAAAQTAEDELLRNQSARIYARLETVVREAWDMLDAMADRVVELARVK